MSYQEKRSIIHVVSFVLFTGIYALIIWNKYNNGDFSEMSDMRFWATVIVISIPIQIAVSIVVQILTAIATEISSEIKGTEREEIDIVDERDRLIELKTMKGSNIVFALGFIAALITQMFETSIHVFFIVVVVSGILSQIFEQGLKIYYYRNGV